MDSPTDQSSFHPPSSHKMPIQAGGDRRFSSDVKRADPIPASYLDASIPLNLPPRRSMKMLKDGSDFVWPDSAHALFVQGLQAWKVLNIGSKRTRAPRGEGKTDFLVRFLQSHGVERSKKQVASHLQVLRTEWRNLDNPVLLSLVDESHSRSMSESALPPLATAAAPSGSSVFEDSPDPNDDRTTPVSGSPHNQSPLRQASHSSHSSNPSQSLSIITQNPIRIQSSPDVSASWQAASHSYPTWSNPHTDHHLMTQQQLGFSSQSSHNIYHDSYNSPISPHDYGGNAGPLTSSPESSQRYHSPYYSRSGPLSSSSRQQMSLPMPEGSALPIFHVHPNHPYHQNFSSNTSSTYVHQQTRPQNDYRLMNYPTPYDAVAQARRPSLPYPAPHPNLYDPSSDSPYHPGFDPSESH